MTIACVPEGVIKCNCKQQKKEVAKRQSLTSDHLLQALDLYNHAAIDYFAAYGVDRLFIAGKIDDTNLLRSS